MFGLHYGQSRLWGFSYDAASHHLGNASGACRGQGEARAELGEKEWVSAYSMIFHDILNIADPWRNRFLSEDRQFCHPCFLERLVPNLVQMSPDRCVFLQPCSSADVFCCFFVLFGCLSAVGFLRYDRLPTGVGYVHSVTNEDAVFVLLVGARYYLPVVERQADHLFPPWCCSLGTWRR